MAKEKNIKEMSSRASSIKRAITKDKNIDILLYLAKYNPNITKTDISENFGKKSLKGLKELEKCNLVQEGNTGNITLTEEGIFQVEGLMTLAV